MHGGSSTLILARPEFRCCYLAALVGQLRSLLMEVFASQSPLQGVLLQRLSIRVTYSNLSPISRSDDVESSTVREADPAIWGISQVQDGRNPIPPQWSEHGETLLCMAPSVFEVLIKLTAPRPGLLMVPQFS